MQGWSSVPLRFNPVLPALSLTRVPSQNARGESGDTRWVFVIKNDVEVHHLEVGLRKCLRQRVAQVFLVCCISCVYVRARVRPCVRGVCACACVCACVCWVRLTPLPVQSAKNIARVFSLILTEIFDRNLPAPRRAPRCWWRCSPAQASSACLMSRSRRASALSWNTITTTGDENAGVRFWPGVWVERSERGFDEPCAVEHCQDPCRASTRSASLTLLSLSRALYFYLAHRITKMVCYAGVGGPN
jgi:hypothetical protein